MSRKSPRPWRPFETKRRGRATPSCYAPSRSDRGSPPLREGRSPSDAWLSGNFQIRSDGMFGKRCLPQRLALRAYSPSERSLPTRLEDYSPQGPAAVRVSPPKKTKPHQRSKMPPRIPTQETSVPTCPDLSRPHHHLLLERIAALSYETSIA